VHSSRCAPLLKRTEQYVGITLELRPGPDRAALRIRDGSWPIHSAFRQTVTSCGAGDKTLAHLNIFTAIAVSRHRSQPSSALLARTDARSSCTCRAAATTRRVASRALFNIVGRLAVATKPSGLARIVPLREGR
jgi:hypothetical protein